MNSRVDCQPKTTPASSDSSRSYLIQPQKRKKKFQKFCRHHQIAKSPGYKKGLQKFISTCRSHKRKHFHKSSFSFSSSSSRIFRFLLVFQQEGYSLRSVIEDGSCMHYKIECGYCCEWQ